jgi:hypothetical protein
LCLSSPSNSIFSSVFLLPFRSVELFNKIYFLLNLNVIFLVFEKTL